MNQLFETPISTSNLFEPSLEEVWKLMASSVDETGKLISGRLVSRLESELCDYHQSKYCVAFSTGFWALVAAVRAKSLPERSEVIIPSMTYRRLADAVFWTRHVPVFVDIEPENLSVCSKAVESAVSDETALILAVHPVVNCCDIDRLMEVASNHDVPIVFDAVESVHETHSSQRIGSFGVGEVFSLHASKLINGLEGGYVCTNEASMRDQLVEARNGCWSGIDGILNDGHAAFALAGLAEIDQNVIHNELVYRTYLEELDAVAGIELQRFQESEQTSFKNIVAKVTSEYPLTRDELVGELNQLGVLARPHYDPPLHSKTYRFATRAGPTTVADFAAKQYINLPCGSRVTPSDVRRVCSYLRDVSLSNSDAVDHAVGADHA